MPSPNLLNVFQISLIAGFLLPDNCAMLICHHKYILIMLLPDQKSFGDFPMPVETGCQNFKCGLQIIDCWFYLFGCVWIKKKKESQT